MVRRICRHCRPLFIITLYNKKPLTQAVSASLKLNAKSESALIDFVDVVLLWVSSFDCASSLIFLHFRQVGADVGIKFWPIHIQNKLKAFDYRIPLRIPTYKNAEAFRDERQSAIDFLKPASKFAPLSLFVVVIDNNKPRHRLPRIQRLYQQPSSPPYHCQQQQTTPPSPPSAIKSLRPPVSSFRCKKQWPPDSALPATAPPSQLPIGPLPISLHHWAMTKINMMLPNCTRVVWEIMLGILRWVAISFECCLF